MAAGQVVTFYSYKGGVGRSFALANVAALLSGWGYRVLCIDWDLEAPGLTYYFRTASPEAGLLEMVEGVVRHERPDTSSYVTPVRVGDTGTLDLLAAGRPDESYGRRLQSIDWEHAYVHGGLAGALEEWRADWMRRYDIVLVDSRTGISDAGGICAALLPDVLVLAFTANQQSLEGALRTLVQALATRNRLPLDRPRLRTVPLPSRFDIQVEYERAERWRQTFHERLAHCYRDWAAHGLPLDELIGHTIIPYSAYWSFGEDLPVLSENVREPSYISYRFATLAALLIQRLENTELLVSSRDSYVDAAVRGGRRQDGFRHEIAISHSEETAEPALRLADLLRQTGIDTVVTDEPVLSSWKDQQRVLDDSRHLVMVLGEKPSPHQDREAQYFLRQTLDEGAERRLIPIVTTLAAISRMPHLLQSFQSYDLSRGSLEDAAREIARAFGDERSRSGYP